MAQIRVKLAIAGLLLAAVVGGGIAGYMIGVARAESVYTDELNELNTSIRAFRHFNVEHGTFPWRGRSAWIDGKWWASFYSGVRENYQLEVVFGSKGEIVEIGRSRLGYPPLLEALERSAERNRWILGDTSASKYMQVYGEIAALAKDEFLAAMPKEVPDSCANPRVFSGTSNYSPIRLFLQMRCTIDAEDTITLRDHYLPLAVHYQRGAELPEAFYAHAFRNAANDGFDDLEESFEVMVLKYGSNGEEFDHEWTGASAGIAIDVEQGEVIYWAMYVTSP